MAVCAASLNFGDIARCRGGVAAVMAQPPFTLGMDVCGTVDAAGPGAEEWVGQRVVGITPQSLGGLAEQALAGSWWAAPPELNDIEGSNHAARRTSGRTVVELGPGERRRDRGRCGRADRARRLR